MSFVVIAVLIVLTALAVGYVGLLLEEHAEWREWHVPRGKEFISYPLEYGEHDGLLLTDVEYATCKDLLEVRYTVENRNKGQTPVRNDLILAFQNGIGLRTVCFASMFVRQVRQCFSAVWADGFPRCRHRFPVM